MPPVRVRLRLTTLLCVFQDQLTLLLQGLRDFIPEQNKTALEAAINSLREELEFDGRAMDQIHRALYLFQEAVSRLFLFQEALSGLPKPSADSRKCRSTASRVRCTAARA